ncbi:flagellar export chaperone FlgN [Acetobacter sp. TBRC 12305]|uniref:Flagellar export chaperone FlgN n=1 Tax=Acetobacter garciniae TaxID=2817435 RepID=A0A939HHS6_9PROT|nr:flagellar export chaperone FlgN [Acetobacter garciniae]MBO1324635.1 flagellar export chaperone FlgN [Acetobacter garciniae]MBX0344324.1 flagellar export chaperone FlgN [Acetobacter garciniae]
MSQKMDKSSAQLLRCFDDVCKLIEKENDFLAAGKLSEAVALLTSKQQQMEKLEHALEADAPSGPEGVEHNAPVTHADAPAGDAGTAQAASANPRKHLPQLNAAARRFSDLARRNRVLLRNAIDTQNALLKLIVVDAVQDTGTGYGATGRYTVDSQAHGALALRSDV